MGHIKIHYNTASDYLIETDKTIHEEIYRNFRVKDPSFIPNRFSRFDGVYRFYDKKKCSIKAGLLFDLLDMFKSMHYTYELDDAIKSLFANRVTNEQMQEWLNSIHITDEKGNHIQPYDYQVDAVKSFMKLSKCTLLAATSAGKSLIQYLICRYILNVNPDAKILIVVPTIMLVNQMYSDFDNYSLKDDGFSAENDCYKLCEGAYPYTKKSITIATRKSLETVQDEFFHVFDGLIIDECHGAKARVLGGICDKAINANFRVGLTGTLKPVMIDPMQIRALFGKIIKVITSKELRDSGRATNTKIVAFRLQYSTEDRLLLRKSLDGLYQNEIDFLIRHEKRNEFLYKILNKLTTGNTVIMVDRIASHLEVLAQEIKKRYTDRNIYTIHGKVDSEEREVIKKKIESDKNCILVTNYQTMSTGVSIRNLTNLIFFHPNKSFYRIIQGIGRMMRLHADKSLAKIIDVGDDLTYNNTPNHTIDHFNQRLEFFDIEEHDYSVVDVKL